MLVKTEAIVLHSIKYGETRLIVDAFTRSLGRLSFIVSIPKSPKAAIKKQLFQPMTLLAVEFDHRQRVQLQKLRSARLLHPYATLTTSPEKLAIALFCAEFLYHALRSEQQNEPLYDYVSRSMQWLDASESGFANFHLTFLMRLSRFLGFWPNLSGYVAGSLFDLHAASFTLLTPTHRDFLPVAEAQRVSMLMRMDFPTMHLFRLSRHDRNRIVEVLLLYYRLHLPDFPELKSLSVLQELFA